MYGKKILKNQQIILNKLKRTDNDVRRLDVRTKPQRPGGLWNWVKNTASGIFQVGAQTITIGSLLAGIEEINGLVVALSTQITDEIGASDELLGEEIIEAKDEVEQTIDRMEASTSTHIDKSEENIILELSNNKKDLENYLPDQMASRVVGIPYARFDSMSNYYPTIYFNFVEYNPIGYNRYIRWKARLKIKNEEFTPDYAQRLRQNIIDRTPFLHRTGPNRYYYVSEDKRWKTTIYCCTQRSGEQAVEYMCKIIEENFLPTQGSFTTKRLRKKLSQNIPAVSHIPNNPDNYHEIFIVQLIRVSVLINGAISPITIWPIPSEPLK